MGWGVRGLPVTSKGVWELEPNEFQGFVRKLGPDEFKGVQKWGSR